MSPFNRLQNDVPHVWNMLSAAGRAAYFPKDGILGQTAEAKGKRLDATIGIALEDDGSPMRLSEIESVVRLPPRDVVPYAPSYGLPEFRREWQRLQRVKNPSLRGPASLPVVAAGLTHALRVAGDLFLDDGDTLIFPKPYWGNYDLLYAQAQLRTYPLFSGEGFNVNGLRAQLLRGSPGKRVVLLNFPNNPTGYTPTRSEADGIVQAIRDAADAGSSVVVLIDDAYFGLTYTADAEPESLFVQLCDLHERVLAVLIDGCSKEDFAWGLRVACITFGVRGLTDAAAKALEDKAAGLIRGSVSSASMLAQNVLLSAFRSPQHEAEKQKHFTTLKARFHAAVHEARRAEYAGMWTMLPCNSGYFLCLKLAEHLDAETVRKRLLADDVGVIALPGNLLRIAFSSIPEKNLQELFSKIHSSGHQKTL